MSKILAIDFGKKFIGLAISDELHLTASPLLALKIKDQTLDEVIASIIRISRENSVENIVLGRPRHLTGEVAKVEGLKQLKKGLEKTGFLVDFEDESGTTLEAEKRLKKRKIPHKQWRGIIDAEAANVILESYLRQHK